MSLFSVEKLNETAHARQLGIELHRTYKNAWNTLKMEHEAGLDSLEVTAQLTRLMDEIVTYVYERTNCLLFAVLAVLFTSFLVDEVLKTWTWFAALVWMGAACFINASRCARRHSRQRPHCHGEES